MAVDSPWYSQDTKELAEEWFYFLSPGARLAWIYLKAHVKTEAVSQKQPNRAHRISPVVAAHQWRLDRSDVEEMERAAIECGALKIEDGYWFVVDRLIFQSERTAQRYSSVCPTNDDKPNQTPPPCHVTETETETETLGESPKPPLGLEVVEGELIDESEVPIFPDDGLTPKRRKATQAQFEALKEAYPRREGGQEYPAARKKLDALLLSGVDFDLILAAAGAYKHACAKAQKIGTPYVKQLSTWLNRRCFEDEVDVGTGGTLNDTMAKLMEGSNWAAN